MDGQLNKQADVIKNVTTPNAGDNPSWMVLNQERALSHCMPHLIPFFWVKYV